MNVPPQGSPQGLEFCLVHLWLVHDEIHAEFPQVPQLAWAHGLHANACPIPANPSPAPTPSPPSFLKKLRRDRFTAAFKTNWSTFFCIASSLGLLPRTSMGASASGRWVWWRKANRMVDKPPVRIERDKGWGTACAPLLGGAIIVVEQDGNVAWQCG